MSEEMPTKDYEPSLSSRSSGERIYIDPRRGMFNPLPSRRVVARSLTPPLQSEKNLRSENRHRRGKLRSIIINNRAKIPGVRSILPTTDGFDTTRRSRRFDVTCFLFGSIMAYLSMRFTAGIGPSIPHPARGVLEYFGDMVRLFDKNSTQT